MKKVRKFQHWAKKLSYKKNVYFSRYVFIFYIQNPIATTAIWVSKAHSISFSKFNALIIPARFEMYHRNFPKSEIFRELQDFKNSWDFISNSVARGIIFTRIP